MESNAENNWVFDVLQKKTVVNRIFTTMIGSVVLSNGSSSKSTKRKGGDDKENSLPNPTGKRSRTTAPKAKASSLPKLPTEKDITVTTVSCSIGIRNKTWVDDLVKCAEHVTNNIASVVGSSEHGDWLKSYLVRQGLLFAFNGSLVIETSKGTKQCRRWSNLRPALIDHGVLQMVQDRYDKCNHTSIK